MKTVPGKSTIRLHKTAALFNGPMRWFKPLLAMLLLGISSVASAAVQVVLIAHNQTSGSGTVSTLITDGSHVDGFAASTVTWTWDGTTLTGSGLYSTTSSLGSSPYSPTILNDSIVDLSIDTGTAVATGTEYKCNEGSFLAGVGASGCGGYQFGGNYTDESATIWSGTSTSQTIGGDDILTGGVRTIAAYNFGSASFSGVDGRTIGDLIFIGNGIPLGGTGAQGGGEKMTFQVVAILEDVADDSLNMAINTSTTIDVLANDLGFQDPVTVDIPTPPANGSAVVNGSPGNQADIDITYTPVTGFEGTDTFEYLVDDGVNQDTAVVTVNVVQPVAGADAVDTPLNTPADIDVLANDGPFADPVTVSLAADPAHGSAMVIGSPGAADSVRIRYVPVTGFSGTDSFDYEVSDGVNMASATVSVTVLPFVAQDDEYTVLKIWGWQHFYVARNDIGFIDPVSVAITSAPSIGTTVVNGSPGPKDNIRIGYYGNPNLPDYTVDIGYQISSGGNQDSATLTVHLVTFAALDDEATTAAGQPVTVPVSNNDIGFGSSRAMGIFLNPRHGSAVVNGSGGLIPSVTYTPDPGFLGDDTFEYAVDDGTYVDIASVTIHVITDTDNDLIDDNIDNCLDVANADQRDSDGDGYGNWCDADFNDDGFVNFTDLAEFKANFATVNPEMDLDGSGMVNFPDLARFKVLFGKPPGPSAQKP